MNPRPQLDSLTCARGVAAWIVVLFHVRSGMPWLPDILNAILEKGYLAVDFFFLLSGFVVWLTAQPAFAAQGFAATPDFLRRRFVRIYPLYGFMLLLTAAFAVLLMATGRNASGYPWAEFPLHVIMIQNWGFTPALSWNHPAWSISTEFAAYLLFPFLVLLFAPLARVPRWALALAIIGLIAVMTAWMDALGFYTLGGHIVRTGLMRCLFQFAIGCLLCALWQRGAKRPRMAPVLLALASGTVAAFLWAGKASHELWAFPLLASSAIYLLAEASRGTPTTRQKPLHTRALLYLGEISYATYLSHFMLFIWFKIALVDNPANIAPSLIGLYLLLVAVASMLLHHLIEKPGRALFSIPIPHSRPFADTLHDTGPIQSQ